MTEESPALADEPDTKVAVYLPESLHKRAKVHAVQHEVALSNLFVALLQQHLADDDAAQAATLAAARALTAARRQRGIDGKRR